MSSFRQKPKITRKEAQSKMDEMASLMVAMEATLMEWEVWFRLKTQMKKNMTPQEYECYINDGPIFTEIPEKIMESIRKTMPNFEIPKDEEKKPVLFDGSGNVAKADDKPILTNSSGQILNTK